ncbi:uncharacterized protein Z518_08861 [Rhinocladiella mackenziei CBS 650.93]|uniref:Uncharacterized protein n=1 Tax=Rhinocladiella mackenziei CBS 650.93 TaxID=1442369 RepID=A0A0D2GXM0_9EURO|nr:uncharacterized protein Z518_08861 [Rhinocladiella mackenziei CBS 650.93]KIX02918.1 hypothetical protein Z518_08861 [Rhinocladiella mackenziei CBS 650.93]
MDQRGRLGLLVDVDTELEIDALCDEWLLPPACTEDDEEDQDGIEIQHVEWIDGRNPLIPIEYDGSGESFQTFRGGKSEAEQLSHIICCQR